MGTLKQFFMTVVSALLLVSTSAFGGECTSVKFRFMETGFSTDPEVCDGFDFCVVGKLKGGLRGEFWHYSDWALQELYDPYDMGLPTLNVGAAEQKIYTADGEIHTKAYGIYENETTVFGEVSVVTGGTGMYEGATGQWVAYPDASKPSDYYYGTIYMLGRICTQ